MSSEHQPFLHVAFRPSRELGQALALRPGGRSEIAVGALERYFFLIREALASVVLDHREARLLVDTLHGRDLVNSMIPSLWHSAVSAVRRRALDPRHGVDGAALSAKLAGADPPQMVAIIDAVERYWDGRHCGADPDEALEWCGLTWAWARLRTEQCPNPDGA